MYNVDSEFSVNGRYSDGNKALGIKGTKVVAHHLNAIQLEMANLVTAGGLELNKHDNFQMYQAIMNIAKSKVNRTYTNGEIGRVTENEILVCGDSVVPYGAVFDAEIFVSGIAMADSGEVRIKMFCIETEENKQFYVPVDSVNRTFQRHRICMQNLDSSVVSRTYRITAKTTYAADFVGNVEVNGMVVY